MSEFQANNLKATNIAKLIAPKMDEHFSDAFPALVFDIGVYSRTRQLGKSMLKNIRKVSASDVRWDTPIITGVCYQIIYSEKECAPPVIQMCAPSEEELLTFEVNGSLTKKFTREMLLDKLAQSTGIDEDTYLQCAENVTDVIHSMLDRAITVKTIVSHNLDTDLTFLFYELHRRGLEKDLMPILNKNLFCTMRRGMSVANTILPGQRPRWPRLAELYKSLYGERVYKVLYDIELDLYMARDCFLKLL